MSVNNRMLNETFPVKGTGHVIKVIQSMEKNDSMREALDGEAWQQSVAGFAFGGIPEADEDALAKLEACEVDWRTAMAIPSKRPGGARSGGTGFKLHPTFKSYKSTIKGAIENGVELLDAAGEPRSRNEVSNEIKEAKKVERTPEEKFSIVIETACKLLPECDTANPLVTDAVNKLTNMLRASNLI